MLIFFSSESHDPSADRTTGLPGEDHSQLHWLGRLCHGTRPRRSEPAERVCVQIWPGDRRRPHVSRESVAAVLQSPISRDEHEQCHRARGLVLLDIPRPWVRIKICFFFAKCTLVTEKKTLVLNHHGYRETKKLQVGLVLFQTLISIQGRYHLRRSRMQGGGRWGVPAREMDEAPFAARTGVPSLEQIC